MRKNILFLLIQFFAISLFSQDYKLIWQDDFNVFDEANTWNAEVNGDGGGNYELQFYRRENISIEHYGGSSCLVLSARRENFGNSLATSARINTHEKVAFQYGKLEARIKLPKTKNGLWPAFWMLGHDFKSVQWPRCGEIDIFETGHADGISQGTQTIHMNGALHWGEYHHLDTKFSNAPYSLQDDFHLFTLIWDKDSIKMYLDLDKYPDTDPYFAIATTGTDVKNNRYHYFHKPYNVLFNLAVGGAYTGITGNSNIDQITALSPDGSSAKMYVDYIRLFQKGLPGEKFYNGTITIPVNSTPVDSN